MQEKGFSLIEVILVTMMIALLATVAQIGITVYLTESKTQVANSHLSILKAALRLYILDQGMPTTLSLPNDLVPQYLPELPFDPFASGELPYIIEIRVDPADGVDKIFVGSRGANGKVDYGGDDLYYYLQ